MTPTATGGQAGKATASQESGRGGSGATQSIAQGSSSTLSGESSQAPSAQPPGQDAENANATVNPGNSNNSPGLTVGKGPNTETDSSRSDNKVRAILDGILAELQRGSITKLNTTSRICEFIQSFTNLSSDAKEITLRSYLGEINATQVSPGPAQGCSGLVSEESSGQPAVQGSRARSPEARSSQAAIDEFIDLIANNSRPGSPDGEDTDVAKCQRLRRSEMPWFSQEQSDSLAQWASCIRSTQTLELLNGDL
ncbi:hypothetical protein CVT26_003742 [Gymnopilus dilepis]|uniref:Uncharacterized protein n=1 Tax=Gymnopilus dilepis TaxID=231916 RepID=A0A409YXD8_9AGAR|nr:hypothetical protein CVT26_003742 [Gymnopilus dilepis]